MIGTRRTAADSLSAERPFSGLRPFDVADRAFFFGREDQIYALYRLLDLSRFVAVIGSSGSGKSSVVLAGLVPLLEDETAGRGGRTWHIAVMTPGDAPIARLATALLTLGAPAGAGDASGDDLVQWGRVAHALQSSSFGLTQALAEIRGAQDSSVLVVVDQFEELFRYASSDGDRAAQARWNDEARNFVQLLLEATRDRAADVHVVITMRSDFIGDCARFFGLPEAVSAAQFLTPALTRDQREEVIRCPLGHVGASIEPALVERLLNDAGNDSDQLPVLQHTLLRLWERARTVRPGETVELRVEDYRAIGEIRGALSQHADEVMADLPGLAVAVEQVFRALSERDKEGRATRRAIPCARLRAETGVADDDLRRVVDRFRRPDCSFLLPSLAAVPVLEDHTRIDVVHEALLRRWTKVAAETQESVGNEEAQTGWLRSEAADGRLYRALLGLVEGAHECTVVTLPLEQVEERALWWNARPRTAAWADRYGGKVERVQRLIDDSVAACDRHRADAKAAVRRRWTIAGAVMGALLILAAVSIAAFVNAERSRGQWLVAQSRFLARDANAATAQGDASTGMLLALEALPDQISHPDRPFVQAAEYALENAVANRREILDITGHADSVKSAVFSPDGMRVLTASDDATARVWDATSGKQIQLLTGHRGPIWSAAFSPDGTRVVTASTDGDARVWDVTSGAPVVLRGHTQAVTSAAFSPDGARVVTASYDETARVWDARSGAPIRALGGHAGHVNAAAFSPDGKRVVTADDALARIWDASSGALIRKLGRPASPVWSAAFSPDGKHVITASDDAIARVWDASSGAAPKEFRGHESRVWSAVFSNDGKRVVTASDDATARVWDARGGAPILVLRGHAAKVYSAAFSDDGRRVVTASSDKTARVWDATTSGSSILVLRGHQLRVWSVAFSPDGTRLVTASEDKTARVWDATSGAPTATFSDHTSLVFSAAFSPDGKRVITASDDKTARIWDAANGAPILVLTGHKDAVAAAEFSVDGRRAVTASDDKTARVWDATSGALIAELRGHAGYVYSAAFSPDGQRVVTASVDRTARVWNATSGALIVELRGHDGGVLSAAFSPDGKRVVTASSDKTARLWNAASGAPIRELRGHEAGLWSVMFSTDGKRVVTASDDGTTRVWDATSGAPILVLHGHEGPISSAAFSPDGKLVATASGATARVLLLPPRCQELIDRAHQVKPRTLTESQRELDFLGPRSSDPLASFFTGGERCE